MSQWQFIAQDRNGAAFADLAPYLRERVIETRLSRPHRVTGTIGLETPSAKLDFLQSGVHELKVKRDGDYVGGVYRLVDVGVTLNPTGGGVLSLEWECIRTYLAGMNIAPATSITDAQSQHAMDLIDQVQGRTGGHFGITQGAQPVIDPSKTRTYDSEVDCLTSIQDLAARENGFDFDVDSDRAFNCYYPSQGSDNGLVLSWPGEIRAMSYNISSRPGSMTNELTVKQGDSTSVTASDATSRALYGRQEGVLSLTDLTEATGVLDEYAAAYIAGMKDPVFMPAISIDSAKVRWDDYDIGDTVTIRAKVGDGSFVDIDEKVRILGVSVALSDENRESISLTIDTDLAVLLNRKVFENVEALRKANATNLIGSKTMEERIAALERYIS